MITTKKKAKSLPEELRYINYNQFTYTKLETKPFEYMVVSEFITKHTLDAVIDDFPAIKVGGSFPLDIVKCGKEFLGFIEELKGDSFRKAVEEKFTVSLINRPVMITARGQCGNNDGKIHIDSKGKIITVLVYLNKKWDIEGGKLRLLSNRYNLENYVVEVTPLAGTLIIFKCCDHAWHGHKKFIGERQSIQLNWVIDSSYLEKERIRHKISALFKKIKSFFKS